MDKDTMLKEGQQFALKIKGSPIVNQIFEDLKQILDKKVAEASDKGYKYIQTFQFTAGTHYLEAYSKRFTYTEYGYKPLLESYQTSGLKIAITNMIIQYLQQNALVKSVVGWDIDYEYGYPYIQFYVKPNPYDTLKDW